MATLDGAVDAALALFFVRVVFATVVHRQMFVPRYGRVHRLLGLVMLLVLLMGLQNVRHADTASPLVSSILMASYPLLGLLVSYSAAREFGPAHRRVAHEQASGILDETATVSESEMYEVRCSYAMYP
jgi:hypothetical protein